MEKQVVVITTDIRLSQKKILAAFHAMDPRDACCARLIKRMSFLGW
jgi:hypothetical protein